MQARNEASGRERRGRGIASALLAVVLVGAAAGTTCPARGHAQDAIGCVDRLSDEEVRARLRFLDHSFRHQRATAIPWFAGWLAFNAVSALISWAGFSQAPHGVPRDTWLMNALGSSFFVVSTSALPLPGIYARHRFEHHMPDATPEDRRRKLRRGTELLEWSAFVEESSSNYGAQLAAAGFTLGSSAYILFRNLGSDPRRIARGVVIQGVTTQLFAELTLLSVPRRARRDWEIYRGFACSDPRIGTPDDTLDVDVDPVPPPAASRGPRVHFVLGFGTVGVAGRF